MAFRPRDPFRAAGPAGPPSRASVRRHALPRMLVWGLVTLAVTALLAWYLSSPGVKIFSLGATVPGVTTLVYALEFVSGVPFGAWSRRWDGLSPLRKLALGTVVVLSAFLFIAIGMSLAAGFGLVR